MTQKQFWKPLFLFITALLSILLIREYVSYKLIKNGVESYQIHTLVSIGANIILIFVSYLFISKNQLFKISGLKGAKLKKWYLLLFPLIYLTVLNALFLDDINTSLLFQNMGLLIVYTLSIGVSEELSIRGFLQSYLIKHYGNTKKQIIWSIIISSLFFGIIHLINFDKGFYGELSQVFFATFIGIMFGTLLVITKSIYPLILIHSIIDFVAKMDKAGLPVKQKIAESMSWENAMLSVLLVLPCFLYGLFLMKKHKLTVSK